MANSKYKTPEKQWVESFDPGMTARQKSMLDASLRETFRSATVDDNKRRFFDRNFKELKGEVVVVAVMRGGFELAREIFAYLNETGRADKFCLASHSSFTDDKFYEKANRQMPNRTVYIKQSDINILEANKDAQLLFVEDVISSDANVNSIVATLKKNLHLNGPVYLTTEQNLNVRKWKIDRQKGVGGAMALAGAVGSVNLANLVLSTCVLNGSQGWTIASATGLAVSGLAGLAVKVANTYGRLDRYVRPICTE